MKRVLVVDDSTMMRRAIGDYLSKMNYEVIGQATNGKEAIEFTKEYKPDFITLDITMPEMDGLEALSEIMQIDPNVRVIIVTAQTSQRITSDALKKGAKTFVNKPFSQADLVEAFEEAMEN